MSVTLELLDPEGLKWAQRQVTKFHYLHRPVDARCSVFGYAIAVSKPGRGEREAGLLLFGRPEATRCGTFYGSVEARESGRVDCTRWQILNLARVWVDSSPASMLPRRAVSTRILPVLL
jgi:hypothetical protein